MPHLRTPLTSAFAAATLVCFGLIAGCKPQADAPGGLVVEEQVQAEKLNAYVVAFNKLLQWHRFDKILREYREENPRVAEPGVKLDGYDFWKPGLDSEIKAFDQALATPGALPDLDAKAKSLRDALIALRPVYEEANAYSKAKEYLSDGGEKAHKMDRALVAGLKAADSAMDDMGAALSAQTLKRDQARLATLKAGSLEHQKLKAVLAARGLSEAIDAVLEDKAAMPAFHIALKNTATASAELGLLKPDPNARPAWDPICRLYKGKLDDLIGIAREIGAGWETGDAQEVHDGLVKLPSAYNDSVDAANRCDG